MARGGESVCVCACVCARTAKPVFRATDDRPHDYNATVGDDVVFRCSAYARPDAVVVWYKNGEEINPFNRTFCGIICLVISLLR